MIRGLTGKPIAQPKSQAPRIHIPKAPKHIRVSRLLCYSQLIGHFLHLARGLNQVKDYGLRDKLKKTVTCLLSLYPPCVVNHTHPRRPILRSSLVTVLLYRRSQPLATTPPIFTQRPPVEIDILQRRPRQSQALRHLEEQK